MTCDATFWACECSLDEHPDFIPHHCTADDCDGLWLDNPDDPKTALVVRYPVAAANAAGISQPIEPIPEPRNETWRPAMMISFPRPTFDMLPGFLNIVDAGSTEVRGELT